MWIKGHGRASGFVDKMYDGRKRNENWQNKLGGFVKIAQWGEIISEEAYLFPELFKGDF